MIKRVFGILCLLALIATGCTRVPAGYTGIKVNMYGTERGVSNEKIVTGWVFYNPLSQKIYKFPTFMQTAVWTKDTREGSPYDESITFQTNDGLTINADVAMNYYFIPDKVPELFRRFRKQPKEIEATYLRTKIRAAFVDVAAKWSVEDFIRNKAGFLRAVEQLAKERLEPQGFRIDIVTFIGSPRVPQSVTKSIEAKIEATQLAEKKKRELEQARADAEKLIARAKGEAEARIIKAKAIAQANRIIAQSLTRELILYEAVKKWNGVQPRVVSGESGLLLNLGEDLKR